LLRAPQALAKLQETWAKVEFVFQPHRGGTSGGANAAADAKGDVKGDAMGGSSSSSRSGAGPGAIGSSSSGEVCTMKMAEEDFEALEDNQVLVQVRTAVSLYCCTAVPLCCVW
jgi:hypothetical protein